MFHPESAPEAALHRAEPEERPRLGLPVAPERLLSAIRRAKRSVAIAALAGSVVGTAAAKTVAPRQFRATGTFAYEAPGGSSGDEARRLETITSSVKLPNVLSEARARLGGKSGIDELGKKIEVGTAEQSNLFTISASAGAPDEAKELTDAIIAAFLEAQTALAEKRAKETLDLKRKETSAAKRRAEAARKAWDEFRKEHGVADPSAEAAAALSEIARLQTEGKLAAVDATAEVAREKVLREVLKKLPATMVLAARESRPALVRLAELQAEKKRLEGHLTPDHPKLGALAAEIESLSSLALDPSASVVAEKSLGVNPELGALSQGVHGSVAQQKAAEVRSSAIASAVADAQKNLAHLLGLEGRAATLLAEVRGAQARLDECRSAEATALDAIDHPQSGIRVVASPLTPELPAKTSRKAVAIATPILAALVALIVALVRAIWGLKIVAPSELAFWSHGSVPASGSWPEAGDPTSLRSELAGALVVPIGEREASLCERLVPRSGRRTRVLSRKLSAEQVRTEVRRAQRVVVVVCAGSTSIFELLATPARLGRDDLEWVMLSVGPELATARDRFVLERSR